MEDRERLNIIMKELKMNPFQLAKALNYKNQGSVSNIGKIVNGKKIKMGIRFIDRLIAKYPNVNIKFAKYGKGEVLLKGKALIAQINALGNEEDKQISFEEEIRARFDEINDKLDLLLRKSV